MDAASAAALLGLTGNGLSAGYGTAPSYPAASFGLGGASSNTLAGNLAGYGGGSGFVSGNGLGGSPAFCSLGAAPASPYAQAAGPFSQPAGGSGSAADSALAALAALLGASGVAPPPPPASPPPVLTAAQVGRRMGGVVEGLLAAGSPFPARLAQPTPLLPRHSQHRHSTPHSHPHSPPNPLPHPAGPANPDQPGLPRRLPLRLLPAGRGGPPLWPAPHWQPGAEPGRRRHAQLPHHPGGHPPHRHAPPERR